MTGSSYLLNFLNNFNEKINKMGMVSVNIYSPKIMTTHIFVLNIIFDVVCLLKC